MARSGFTASGVEMQVVPVYHDHSAPIELREGAQLVFYGGSNCDTPVELLTYKSKDPLSKQNNLCEFTGGIAVINFCDCSQYGFELENGSIEVIYDTPVENFEECNEEYDIQPRGIKYPCPTFGTSWWDRFTGWFGGFFNGFGGGSSNNGNGGIRINTFMSGTGGWNGFCFGFPNYGLDLDNYNTSGGGVSMGDLFSFNIFSGEGVVAINQLNRLIAENNLIICTEQLHNLLYQCISSGNPDPESCGMLVEGGSSPDPNSQEDFEIDIHNYVDALLDMDGSNACMTNIVSMFSNPYIDMTGDDGLLICYINENNDFNISDEDLLDLVKGYCNGNEECEVEIFKCLGKLSQYEDAFGYEFTPQQIENYVFSGDYSLCDNEDEEFLEEMDCMRFTDEFDEHIIIDPSFSSCEAYDCMLEFLSSTGNAQLCDMIGHIIDSDSYTIKFETGFVAGDGSTKISDIKNKEITVKFHYSDCDLENVDQLEIAETLLHESQHANFYAELFELGLEEYTSEAVKAKWVEYVEANFDIQYANQHQAMVQNYMELAATYLWELNNKTLTPQHYMKYVWDGLSHVWEGAFTPSMIASWEDKYKELNGIEPYNVNQNSFSCQ